MYTSSIYTILSTVKYDMKSAIHFKNIFVLIQINNVAYFSCICFTQCEGLRSGDILVKRRAGYSMIAADQKLYRENYHPVQVRKIFFPFLRT